MNNSQAINKRTTTLSRRRRTWRALAAVLLAAAGAGCADVQDADMPSVSMADLVAEGDVSPACGDSYEGSLKAQVPMRGVTATAGDLITAFAWDGVEEEWVELGSTTADPVAMVKVDGEPMYAFDFGTACTVACDLTISPYVWRGVGPFRGRFKFYSEAHGWLPAPVPAGTESVSRACLSADPAEIAVVSLPLP